jgi:hypothetical protein
MKRARTCTACTPQLSHGMSARMQPDGRHDRPCGVLDARSRGRASMQPDGRHGHARRHTRTTTRHSFAPGNGNDITHLQDHVVVDSKILNARLHVLSCDESGGADLVSQLLHSLFVTAVEVFSVGQQADQSVPSSRSRAAAALLRPCFARWDCLLRSIYVRSRTALRMLQRRRPLLASLRASTLLAAPAALHAAALAGRMRSDKGNGCARAPGTAAGAVDARTPPSRSS